MNALNLAYKTKKEIANARLIAFCIDYFIIFIIFLIAERFIPYLQNTDAGFILFMTITSLAYFISLEFACSCTLGKFIMGLCIIDKNCNKASFKKVVLRSFLRLITFIHPSVLVLWILQYIVIYNSIFKQNLLDKLAGTFIVYKKDFKLFKANSSENSMGIDEFINYINLTKSHISEQKYNNNNNISKVNVYEEIDYNNVLVNGKVTIEFNGNKLSVVGIKGLSVYDIISQVNNGARFAIFYECFSLFIYSKKSPSNIYFIKPNEKKSKHGRKHSLITFIFGWWGFPWGIIWSIECLSINSSGGIDVTNDVLQALKYNRDSYK